MCRWFDAAVQDEQPLRRQQCDDTLEESTFLDAADAPPDDTTNSYWLYRRRIIAAKKRNERRGIIINMLKWVHRFVRLNRLETLAVLFCRSTSFNTHARA